MVAHLFAQIRQKVYHTWTNVRLLPLFLHQGQMLPATLAVTQDAHDAGNTPGQSLGQPHAPIANPGNPGQDGGKHHPADNLADAVHQAEPGIAAAVEQAPGNVNHGRNRASAPAAPPCQPRYRPP